MVDIKNRIESCRELFNMIRNKKLRLTSINIPLNRRSALIKEIVYNEGKLAHLLYSLKESVSGNYCDVRYTVYNKLTQEKFKYQARLLLNAQDTETYLKTIYNEIDYDLKILIIVENHTNTEFKEYKID